MHSCPKVLVGRVIVAATAALSLGAVSAQQPGSPSNETVIAPITVTASGSTAAASNAQFISTFIATASRLEKAKFISYVGTAVSLRPDLAPKIVVCAFNIARLNSHLAGSRLSFDIITQIVKVAVTSAPQAAATIVKAAIESEPYARRCVVAAAMAAAPAQTVEIQTAASQIQSIFMLASALPIAFNPADNGGVGPVTSPEQPPAAP